MRPPWEADEAARRVHESIGRLARERLAERVLGWDDEPERVPEELRLDALAITLRPGGGAEEVTPIPLVVAALAALAEVDAGIALRVLARQLATGAAGPHGLREPVGLALAGSDGILAVACPPAGLLLSLDDARMVRRAPVAAGEARHWTLGCRTAPLEWCTADGCAVPPALAQETVRGWLVVHLEIGLAAIAFGVASAALVAAGRYAAERYQGGRVIAGHAAVRGLLAASHRRLAAAATALAVALDGDDAGAAHLALESALVAAEANASDGVQVHGGYGYMHEYGAEKRLRDAKTLALLLRAGAS